eukprot:COSAG04_NODE_25082_length_312_cov_0.732394_1_plen_45_part_01
MRVVERGVGREPQLDVAGGVVGVREQLVQQREYRVVVDRAIADGL